MNKLFWITGVGDNSPSPFNPTRDEIIGVMGNFCNLRDADDIPIFETAIDDLIINEPAKARDWITRLKAAGSTHVNVSISGAYREDLGWIHEYPYTNQDWTRKVEEFGSRVLDYLLGHRLIPIVHLASDGQGYDPIGQTYGWQWGMDNVPSIISRLSKYKNKCLWNGGWDGCFPDWTPEQTIKYIQMLRAALGYEGQISIEFGAGPGESISYSHMGNGQKDWDGILQEVDAFFTELQVYPGQDDGVSEVATRLLGPEATNTVTTPYYLIKPRARGKCAIVYFETVAYWAIRKLITPEDARIAARQGSKYGFKYFGNGLP